MSNIAEGIEQKALQKGILIGEKRALAKGKLETSKKIALNMLKNDEPLEKIVQYTEFPIEVIQSWVKE